MTDEQGAALALVTERVGDRAEEWDRSGEIPGEVVRALAESGLLCAQVPAEFGGRGFTSEENGRLTAHTGSLCSSVRSLMTSQGMAAWAVQRLGDHAQQRAHLTRLASGAVAGVAFSEPAAGSDLSAVTTRIDPGDDGTVTVTGEKVWVTGGAYADLLVVLGRHGNGAAVAVAPTTAAGVTVRRVPDPLGCRAAGHADVTLDGVRLPADHLLGGAGLPADWLATSVLTYGRISVAWGCVGILRCCLSAAAAHAATREQAGTPLARHQLVGRHLAELLVAEQAATRCSEHASRCWDDAGPDLATAAVLAKHLAAGNARQGAASAVQVLGSAGARDGRPAARAYRDAKLMEIIEGSSEISQLLLSEHALSVWS